MSSQDRLEHVLRDIHVMISKSEAYDKDRIIVSKKDVFDLIDRLNASVYEIMDEYELTQQSRDRALRENKKEGDKIIWDASRQAEDIYAASVLYTDEALNHLHGIMENANETICRLYKDFGRSMREQQDMIRDNQMELKSQLQLLTDTEKYLNLIEERNREIERERARKKGKKVFGSGSTHKAIKPEIKINEAYFRKAGIPLEDDKDVVEEEMEPLEDEGVIESTLKKVAEDIRKEVMEEDVDESGEEDSGQSGLEAGAADQDEPDGYVTEDNSYIPDESGKYYDGQVMDGERTGNGLEPEKKKLIEDNIKVNLDAEYFKRLNESFTEEPSEESHHAKTSLLDKIMGKKKIILLERDQGM